MTGLLICVAMTAAALVIGRHVFAIGMRNGDRIGDATVDAVEFNDSAGGVAFAVHNPGPQPVVIGASVRRRSPHLRGAARQSVSTPRRTLRTELLAGQHTVIYAIPAGDTQTVIVPLSRFVWRRAELVVALGEPDRLRLVRQVVDLAPEWRSGQLRAA